MNYYRLALQNQHTTLWTWKSTVVTSLEAAFQLLRIYRALPQERLRVFSSTCKEDLARHEPDCVGNHPTVFSVSAAEFLRERKLQVSEVAQQVPDREATEIPLQQPTSAALALSWQAPGMTSDSPGINGTTPERRRLENKRGSGGDHDLPYTFTLPDSLPQILAWIRLSTKVRNGELEL